MNLNHPESCVELRAALPLLVGADLEPAGLEAAHRHLASCKACLRALERAQEARGALGSLRVERPAPDVWRSVRAVLLREGLIDGVLPAPLSAPAANAAPAAMARGPRRLAWARPLAAAALIGTALWATLHLQGASGSLDAPPEASTSSGTPAMASESGWVASGIQARPLGTTEGVTLVSSPSEQAGLPVYPRRSSAPTGRPARMLEPDCPDPRPALDEPVALRPSSDQQPRPTVYFQPEGLWVGAIDLRQLRLEIHPLAGRPNGGVQAAGGQQ